MAILEPRLAVGAFLWLFCAILLLGVGLFFISHVSHRFYKKRKRGIKLDKNSQTIALMFSQISRHYDLMNNLMTGFIHKRTRTKALQLVPFHSDQKVLDLATGTGDFVFLTLKMLKEIDMVIGVDFTKEMLSIAKNRSRKEKFKNLVSFSLADITYLPFQTETFSLCTIGYGIRNVHNPTNVLREIWRITKESGHLIIVEATPANNSVVKYLLDFYFRKVIPIIAKLIFLETNAYRYLAESIAQFPSGQQFVKIIKNAGWKKVIHLSMYYGTVTIFIAKK